MLGESPVTDPCRFGDSPATGLDFQVALAEASIVAPADFFIPKLGAGNYFRGQWGKHLFRTNPNAYRQFFAPTRRATGPSGLADPPRPFVLRVRNWESRTVKEGEELRFGLHLFSATDDLEIPVKLNKTLYLCTTEPVSELVVTFLSPTDLKGGEPWEFPILLARIRDRVSTLRQLYQGGPLALNFAQLGELARKIETVSKDLDRIDRQRRSGTNHQIHPLSGWIGTVRFRGDLARFLPLFRMAEYTGIGRHTVWGQGEIKVSAE